MKFKMWDNGWKLDTKWYNHAIKAADNTWYSADTFIAEYVALVCVHYLRDAMGTIGRFAVWPEYWEVGGEYDDYDLGKEMSDAIHTLAYTTLHDLAVAATDIDCGPDVVDDFYAALAEAHNIGMLWD